MPEDPRLRLAYEEGLRTLAIQREDLERVRSRVIALVSVAALAAGLSGGTVFANGHAPSRAWLYPPIVGFAVLVACVCVVLAPWRLSFETDPRDILSGFVNSGVDTDGTLRWMAFYAGEETFQNRRVLDRLHWFYLAAVLALGSTVTLFLLALTHRT